MKRFVFLFRVEPPVMQTVMVKSGGSVFDAAFSYFFGWQMVLPGGSLEKIAPPEMIFVSEEYAREHPANLNNKPAQNYSKNIRRSKTPVQLSLF